MELTLTRGFYEQQKRKAAEARKAAAEEARKAKVKEQKLSSSKAAQYEDISDSEKRYLFDLYNHSENQGFELWDAVRHYERFLATSSIDRIKI